MEDSRQQVVTAVLDEATAFYKLTVSTATLFLGGTLAFWEKINPALTVAGVVVLGIGWACLIASIGAIVFVRRANIEMGRLALNNEIKLYDKMAPRYRNWTTLCAILLAFGMGFVALAGFMALLEKANERQEVRGQRGNSVTTPQGDPETSGTSEGKAEGQQQQEVSAKKKPPAGS